jgi:hypothetical protein
MDCNLWGRVQQDGTVAEPCTCVQPYTDTVGDLCVRGHVFGHELSGAVRVQIESKDLGVARVRPTMIVAGRNRVTQH